jgi:hypothetical protein
VPRDAAEPSEFEARRTPELKAPLAQEARPQRLERAASRDAAVPEPEARRMTRSEWRQKSRAQPASPLEAQPLQAAQPGQALSLPESQAGREARPVLASEAQPQASRQPEARPDEAEAPLLLSAA